MRRTLALAVGMLSLAALGAAEPKDTRGGGRVGVDLIAAPSFGFGVPIRLTRNLTLRATLGFGSSVSNGAAWNLGSDLRYTFRPESELSLYAAVQACYLHAGSSLSPYGSASAYGSSAASTSPVVYQQAANGALYSGGVGVQRRLGRTTTIWAEGRYGRMTSSGVYDSWGMWGVGGQNSLSFALGATFGLR
jgi:hypothetical protein